MAKSNAERQAEYKARAKSDKKNVNCFISLTAYQALTDKATAAGKTKLETLEDLLLGNIIKTELAEPEQTWCFSPEELQEQARLIERLTTENARLTAELQLARKAKPEPKPIDIKSLDKIQLYQALDAYEKANPVGKVGQCDATIATGHRCKNDAVLANEKDVLFILRLCNTHKKHVLSS